MWVILRTPDGPMYVNTDHIAAIEPLVYDEMVSKYGVWFAGIKKPSIFATETITPLLEAIELVFVRTPSQKGQL